MIIGRVKKFSFFRVLTLFVVLGILFNGCTKLFLSYKELGSKNLPIRFYVDSSFVSPVDSAVSQDFEACLEKQSGYKAKIEYASDQKSLIQFLAKGTAQFALMTAESYIEATKSTNATSLMLLTSKQDIFYYSVILGKTKTWKGNTTGLQGLQNGTFAYASVNRDSDFFAPKLFLTKNSIYPSKAVFYKDYKSILDSLLNDNAIGGAVISSFLLDNYHLAGPLVVGQELGPYTVLALTPGIPYLVMADNHSLSGVFSGVVERSFKNCAATQKSSFSKIFGADGVESSSEKYFGFARELYNFKKEFF